MPEDIKQFRQPSVQKPADYTGWVPDWIRRGQRRAARAAKVASNPFEAFMGAITGAGYGDPSAEAWAESLVPYSTKERASGDADAAKKAQAAVEPNDGMPGRYSSEAVQDARKVWANMTGTSPTVGLSMDMDRYNKMLADGPAAAPQYDPTQPLVPANTGGPPIPVQPSLEGSIRDLLRGSNVNMAKADAVTPQSLPELLDALQAARAKRKPTNRPWREGDYLGP